MCGINTSLAQPGSRYSGATELVQTAMLNFSRRQCEIWWLGQFLKYVQYASLESRSIWLLCRTLRGSLRRPGICQLMRSRESVAIQSYYSFLEINSFPFKMNFIYKLRTLYSSYPATVFLLWMSNHLMLQVALFSRLDLSKQIHLQTPTLYKIQTLVQKMNPGHQPERFEVFNYLPNQRAFTIKDTNHIFYLDRYGGWFDQHGNYYNENAEPDEPPSSSESYSDESDHREDLSSGEDEYERQFGRPDYYSDEQVEQEANVAAVALNLSNLSTYPKNSMVRIYFQNLGYHSNRDEIMTAYKEKVGEIINVIIDRQGNKNKGTGYFILKDVESAANLINLEGSKLIERPLYFEIEKYEDHLLNPIIESEILQKEKPKYIRKKEQQKPIISETKQELIEIPWKWYKFEKDIFPKKTSFKAWMQENGLIFEEDFKNIEKIQNDPEKRYAKVHMKESTFRSINGLQYDGKKVEFVPFEN